MNNILKNGTILRQRYKILETLSSHTGFGITYKVVDQNLPTKPIRVLKQLKQPTPSTLEIENLPIAEQQEQLNQYWAKFIQLFEKETTALAKLGEKYNQIPTIYEQFAEAGEYFYVQEYIDGHLLTAEIQPGKNYLNNKQ